MFELGFKPSSRFYLTPKLILFINNCYSILDMSLGGQEEGGRTHPEVARAPFRFVALEEMVE